MKLWLLLYILGHVLIASSHVIELDQSFLEKKKEGKWLVEFYAPWCGHCKKLEPIYHQVSLTLKNFPVYVAKIDATRFSSVASVFDVNGYPTIKFIHGDKVYTHRGERSEEDIVQFVKKASGPAVRNMASIGRYNEAQSQHQGGVYFLYIGDGDVQNDLFMKYTSIAERMASQCYFYMGTEKTLPQEVKPQSFPSVLVFKDKTWFEYKAPDGVPSMSSLESWIKEERFTSFPRVAGGNINEMAEMGKTLVIIVTDPTEEEKTVVNDRVKDVGETMALKYRDRFQKDFQFLWMSDVETVNGITMAFLATPVVLVLNTSSHFYYFLDFDVRDITVDKLSEFLVRVRNEEVKPHGGTGFLQRLKRIFYDLFTTVLSIWQSSRWLFLLMFGLPTCVISLVCYSICCMEGADDIPEDEEDSEEEDDIVPKEGIDSSENKASKSYHEKAD